MGDKDNHNIHGRFNVLAGLGSTKLRRLIDARIYSMHELLAAQDSDTSVIEAGLQHLLPLWQEKALMYYNHLSKECQTQQAKLDDAEEFLLLATTELDDYNESIAQNRLRPQQGSINNPYRRASVDNDPTPPRFTAFSDKKGYNGKVLSKYRIDSIVTSVFNSRKHFQEAKMKGICASILKIDFNYKLAHKVRVWTKQGQSFVPYKCIVTIQNEDGLTVFWKALKHSESFSEIAEDLKRLRLRLNRNKAAAASPVIVADELLEESVTVVYLDNCCQVCASVKSIFGAGVLVKLDVFHWLKRWNDIMYDAKSALAGLFRALMSRAVFNVQVDEFDRAREKLLEKKKREPTVKEILREAKSVIPEPALLRSNVEAVLRYVQDKDAETEHILSTWQEGINTGPKPQRFLKHHGVRDRIRRQFKHIDKGCLSDPPTDLVNIFRWNSTKDVCYVARGTNTNERDNFDLGHRILTATHIGIHRAERLMCCFFESRNCQKCITRLGEEDYGTYQTEQLLMINGCAKSAGVPNSLLPFPKVSAPTKRHNDIPEFMGFSYCLPCTDQVCNPTEESQADTSFVIVDDDEQQAEDADDMETANNQVANDFGDDFDVEVLLTETGHLEAVSEDNQRVIDEQIRRLDAEADAENNDRLNSELIQAELLKLLPTGNCRESTMQAFDRLAEKNPWFPLRSPDSNTAATETDKAEAAFFDLKSPEYNKLADIDAHNGYKAFANEWNNEVSRRFKAWSCGDDSIIQLRLKKWEFLAEHYDKVEGHKALQASSTVDGGRQELRATFRTNRQQLPTVPAPFPANPPVYRTDGTTPFAAPAVLNSVIAVHAVTGANIAAAAMVNGRCIVPYRVERPLLLPPAPPRRLPVFRSRMFCVTCGWRRNEHHATEGVGATCTRQYCGRCYFLKEHHPANQFGKNCVGPVNPMCAHFVDTWYSVSYLFCYKDYNKRTASSHYISIKA
jgi:hypothetical protein